MATKLQDEFPATVPDGPAAIPSAVGTALRTARERTGKDTAEVARQLRIRQPFLQALEEGRHKDLPGGTYAIGFLRTYAEFLDLDAEEMVRRFKQEAADDLHSRSELVFPSPVSEGRIPNGGLLFIGLMVAAVAYGGWFWLNSRQAKVGDASTALPERLFSEFNRPASLTQDKPAKATPPAAPAPKPVVAAAPAKPVAAVAPAKPEPAMPVVAPAPAKAVVAATPAKPEPAKPVVAATPAKPAVTPAPAKPEPAKDVAVAAPAKAVVAPAPAKPAVTPPPAKPAFTPPPAKAAAVAAAAQATASRVVIKAAADDCWMQVREMDGRLLVSKLLRRGESFDVPDRPGLSLTVGNAGALQLIVDGKALPSLGAIGQVRRDITLDPAKLLQGG